MLNPYGSHKFRVTSPQGMRTLSGVTAEHGGVDLVCDASKAIYAVCDGYVAQSRIVTDRSNKTWEWGNYVAIQDAAGRYVYHCHMSARTVGQGQTVKAGQQIGVEGSTGNSTGSHLHFEVRAKDGVTKLSAADYLGIPNVAGTYGETPPAIVLPPDLSIWAAEAWEWAMAAGITDGSNPRNNVTREEAITMIHRLWKLGK